MALSSQHTAQARETSLRSRTPLSADWTMRSCTRLGPSLCSSRHFEFSSVVASRGMTKRPASLWRGGCRQASRHWRRGCRQAVAKRRATGVASPKHLFYDGYSHNWESQDGLNALCSSSNHRASSSHSSPVESVLASPCASAASVEPALCPCCPPSGSAVLLRFGRGLPRA